MGSKQPRRDEPRVMPPEPAGRPRGQASVLVVDDEPDFCQVIKEILRIDGMLVWEAHNVNQALAMLARQAPDLVLTDVMMPEIDGLEFVRSLRSEPLWSKIPAVVVSARVLEEDREAALQAGANAFLPKPFSARELRETIRPLLAST
ncbi:MAG TPA: response regulator [Anaerolineales bacterium]|nr:response regulator [Anaerolineales bacterium]